MAVLEAILCILTFTFFSSPIISFAHPGLGFGWGGQGGSGGKYFGIFPEFYQYSCPQANDIVMSVLHKAISKDPRMAASLLRLHFHDCFVQVCFSIIVKYTKVKKKKMLKCCSPLGFTDSFATPSRVPMFSSCRYDSTTS